MENFKKENTTEIVGHPLDKKLFTREEVLDINKQAEIIGFPSEKKTFTREEVLTITKSLPQ